MKTKRYRLTKDVENHIKRQWPHEKSKQIKMLRRLIRAFRVCEDFEKITSQETAVSFYHWNSVLYGNSR